jgi:LuxR family transcriptional regulator, maltose regulon positive regulatory protein
MLMVAVKQYAARPLTDARELMATAAFAIPRTPDWHVPRERLLDLLDSSAGRPLVLVSAPAGSGKTELVADWVRHRLDVDEAAWVTAKEPDEAVLPLVLEALARMEGPVPHPRARRENIERPPAVAVAETVNAGAHRITLVLDGFEIASPAAADELQSLIDLTGDGLRVVLVSRVDPVLALYRYRLSDTIVEVRAADLAFTADEARELLARSGVVLREDELRQLLARTRGWAAALRFSARAIRAAGGGDGALAGMEAATTDINEYLLGEVLGRQPPELREFLLCTSVADVLFPGLVEELVDHMPLRGLEDLTKFNAFVESTDQAPGSFRYHPFFRDLLRAQLAHENPEKMADLERRTGSWYVRRGLASAGLPHLAACHAWDLAAMAVVDSRAIIDLILEGEEGQYVVLMRDIPGPDELSHPAARVVRAAIALVCGDDERCARELDDLHTTGRVHDHAGHRVRAAAAVVEALRGRDAEPPEKAVLLADRASEQVAALEVHTSDLPADLGALASNAEAVAQMRVGNVTEARHAFAATLGCGSAVHPYLRAEALGYVALADAIVGRLSQAERNAVRSLALADLLPLRSPRPAAAEVALSWVTLDRYDLDPAAEHLTRAAAGSQAQRNPLCRTFRMLAVAGLLRARGRPSAALSKVRVGLLELGWDDRWLADRLRLEAARLWVASGRPDRARHELTDVVQDRDAKVVSALAHLAEGEDSEAGECLANVEMRSAPLEVAVTKLLADAARYAGQRSPTLARQAVGRGLRLAAREQMRRPFREAPPSVQRMLAHDPVLVDAGRWVHNQPGPALLHVHRGAGVATPATGGSPTGADSVPLEKLTAKELEVVRHMSDLLTTEEIAAEMFISVNTVRTHVRSILRKLRVTRRNAAVRRAREMGLVDH